MMRIVLNSQDCFTYEPIYLKIHQNTAMLKKGLFAFTVITFASGFVFSQANNSVPTPTPVGKETPKANPRPTPMPYEAMPEPFDKADVKAMAGQCVSFDTEAGMIEIEVYPESAPESVRNFLNLAATGLLDTTTFNRVVPGFVIQGGRLWSREGGITRAMGVRARRTIPDEPNKILHERGVVSMARGDEPNSATNDFFILVANAPYLDGKFAAFGRVTKGMDVVDTINKAAVIEEKPEKPVRIKKATVKPCAAAQ
ncbi:MAG: peptidylprolyl isomerase [Acidobacteria bacterium]|nr:peptidylprolyl isomerase [Acidobacteriota bacterium]